MAKYGERLQIIAVDLSQLAGQKLYQAAVQRYKLTQDQIGVPTLIVGEAVRVGSLDILQLFPALIDKGLALEGIVWPDIPGLE